MKERERVREGEEEREQGTSIQNSQPALEAPLSQQIYGLAQHHNTPPPLIYLLYGRWTADWKHAMKGEGATRAISEF